MRKRTAARNAGIYTRLARYGPAGFVQRQRPLPTAQDAVRSYATAWREARIRLVDVPTEYRSAVRDA